MNRKKVGAIMCLMCFFKWKREREKERNKEINQETTIIIIIVLLFLLLLLFYYKKKCFEEEKNRFRLKAAEFVMYEKKKK